MRKYSSLSLLDSIHMAMTEHGYKIVTITIPDYMDRIQTSAKRKAKYYKISDPKLPKTILQKVQRGELKVTKEGVITNIFGMPEVQNKKAAGTPHVVMINNQNLYNQSMHWTQRAKIIDAMKTDYCLKFMEHVHKHPLPTTHQLVGFGISVFRPNRMDSGNHWDLDNHIGMHQKAIQDALVRVHFVQNDDVDHIDFIGPYFFAEATGRKMLVHLYMEPLT